MVCDLDSCREIEKGMGGLLVDICSRITKHIMHVIIATMIVIAYFGYVRSLLVIADYFALFWCLVQP